MSTEEKPEVENNNDTEEVTKETTKKAPKKTFVLKKWTGVALWQFGEEVSNCAICRTSMQEVCIECQANQGSASASACTVAWGYCGHSFHFHCISRWLKTRHSCPLDNSDWNYDRFDSKASDGPLKPTVPKP